MQKGLFRYDVTACETKVTISSALLFDTFHLRWQNNVFVPTYSRYGYQFFFIIWCR